MTESNGSSGRGKSVQAPSTIVQDRLCGHISLVYRTVGFLSIRVMQMYVPRLFLILFRKWRLVYT